MKERRMTLHLADPIRTDTTADPDVARKAFRDGMARLGAAVNIITSDGPAGMAGFTATAVCSVTDTPPTLLVCLNRNASVHQAISQNGILCVNTLAAGEEPLSNLFGGGTPMADRFAAASWSLLETGAPALDSALVSFDCRISSVTECGTHDVFFCEVVSIRRRDDGTSLLYVDRAYRHLA